LAEGEALNLRVEMDFNYAWAQAFGGKHKQNALLNALFSSEEQATAIRRGFELGLKSIAEIAAVEMNKSRKEVDL